MARNEPPSSKAREPSAPPRATLSSIKRGLAAFNEFGKATVQTTTEAETGSQRSIRVETFVNEFWTSRQRQAHSLHEVSYRACFKPQLPRFFIDRLTREGELVYDPFMGRGTTPLEAALAGRVPAGCDVNPLSAILTRPRLAPPVLEEVDSRLAEIDFEAPGECPDELLVFYHPETLRQVSSLRRYLLERERDGELDRADSWIRMVATNRLSGHSGGFFSVYTMPPNQAVSVKSQRKINERRKQEPPPRDVPEIILKKTRSLFRDCTEDTRRRLAEAEPKAVLLTRASSRTPEIEPNSISLVVTSPPFLDVVNYATDNWLRCWFCEIDADQVPISMFKSLAKWRAAMAEVFVELARVLEPGGHVAFEVGEVRKGKLKLEEVVIPCGVEAGLEPALVLINDQKFTKTAHCWGVDNRQKGTNTNRIVLFRKAGR